MCPYCTLPFETIVQYKGETVQSPVGDHFVPQSWDRRSLQDNLVVSCQVCNTLKHDNVYESVEQARRDLLVKRMNKRIVTLFIPQTPLTLDPEAWASEYTRYLSE